MTSYLVICNATDEYTYHQVQLSQFYTSIASK